MSGQKQEVGRKTGGRAPFSLIECVMNVSEGRDERILKGMADIISGCRNTFLLDRASDYDHHRTVFSFAGSRESVGEATLSVVECAVATIDLNRHRGVHPRIGAVDVIPYVPLFGSSMEDCIAVAREVGRQISERFSIPIYLYEAAALREERRNLADIRRGGFEILRGEIKRDPARRPDFGPCRLHPTAGATAVGARGPLIAFNVYLETGDVKIARHIARCIRERDGGLPAVKALGLFIARRQQAQVSMNLIDYHRTSLGAAFSRIEEEAAQMGVSVASSEIIGLIPREAVDQQPIETLKLENFGPEKILEVRIQQVLECAGMELEGDARRPD